MSGRLAWTGTEDFDVLPGRATESVAAVLDRLAPCRALAGKKDEDETPPLDGGTDADLDEDDDLGADDDALDDLDAEDDELDEDDEDLDDELIDLDDEYDDTDEDDRPHPGHRYDD